VTRRTLAAGRWLRRLPEARIQGRARGKKSGSIEERLTAIAGAMDDSFWLVFWGFL
jgi:hypothetical protein